MLWPLLKIYGSWLVNLCLGSICDLLTYLPHVAFLTKESKIHILNLYLHSVAIYVVAFLPYLYKEVILCCKLRKWVRMPNILFNSCFSILMVDFLNLYVLYKTKNGYPFFFNVSLIIHRQTLPYFCWDPMLFLDNITKARQMQTKLIP